MGLYSALVDKNFLSRLVGSICRVVVDLSGENNNIIHLHFYYVTDSLRFLQLVSPDT